MRILAIRGRNLASLAGEFELRLDGPPLASAGLFAITGRTGAGKSTLLDALCLALFDRIPRLPSGRGVEVGRADETPESRLKHNDVRSILRRGAGEGHAEVDFRGVDGCRYRARWSVHRARDRADGRFQNQTLLLQDLDSGVSLGGTKSETLEEIHRRLGLTFDQFRRSVLLAQGDFAAFLRANPNERAELLERITGTDIYGDLSQAAHRRAADERKQLDLIQQRLGDQRPLDADARTILEQTRADAQRAWDAAHQHQQQLLQAQRWYQTHDQLLTELDQAQRQRQEAEQARAEAEPRRLDWERCERLQPLRLPLSSHDQAVAALAQTRQVLEQAVAETQRLQTMAEQAADLVGRSEADHQLALQRQTEILPLIQAARQFDTRIQAARAQRDRLHGEQTETQGLLQTAETDLARLEGRRREAAQSLQTAEDWLASHAALVPLAEQWEVWARELGRYRAARERRETARTQGAEAARAGSELAARRETQGLAIARLDRELAQALETRAALEKQSAALDLAQLAARRETQGARQRQIQHWRTLVEQMAETRTRLERGQSALTDAVSTQMASADRLQAITGEIGPLRAALSEAEAAHQRLLLAGAADVARLRGRLQAGEPCPVCGASEHPWAETAQTTLDALTLEQSTRVAQLRDQLESLTREQARHSAQLEQIRQRRAELDQEIATHQSHLTALLETWSVDPPDPLHPLAPAEPGLVERLDAELAALARQLDELKAQETAAHALAGQLRAQTVAIEGLRIRLEEARGQLAGLDERLRAIAQDRALAEREQRQAGEELDRLLELITPAMAGLAAWRERLESDPDVFIAACEQEVRVWLDTRGQRDQAQAGLQSLIPELAVATTRRQAAHDELARRRAALDEQTVECTRLEQERVGLLGGQPADTVEIDHQAQVALALERLTESRLALGRSRESLSGAQSVVATQSRALEARTAAAAQAEQALAACLAEAEVALPDLRQALERDHGWIEQERQALQVLQQAVDRAADRVAERARRLADHQAASPPDLAPAALTAELTDAGERLRTAQEHWASVQGQIGEDDRRRAASQEIQAALEQQEAVWTLWESLRELIGSADGSRFRNFAQGLTLDLLIAHANVQLRDLTRRYELQRVPGSELELQVVDREMGDEVRGVHSLSGGESFLASLALALGLAALASDRVRVESLFIDEGFGALDADSLDLAIASLDALDSLGRQVGVISHVETLVERIGVRVEVRKEGGGRSRLAVLTG